MRSRPFPRFIFPFLFLCNCHFYILIVSATHEFTAETSICYRLKMMKQKRTFRAQFYDARIDTIYVLIRESHTKINHRAASRILR